MAQEEHCHSWGYNGEGHNLDRLILDPIWQNMAHRQGGGRQCPVGQGYWLATLGDGNKGMDQRNDEDLGFKRDVTHNH